MLQEVGLERNRQIVRAETAHSKSRSSHQEMLGADEEGFLQGRDTDVRESFDWVISAAAVRLNGDRHSIRSSRRS